MFVKLIGLGIIILFMLMILVFAFLDQKGLRSAFREISAYKRLQREIGLSVEGGKKIHITLGRGGVADLRAGSGFIGLSLLSRLSKTVSVSDHPPVVSSGEAVLGILAQDTVKNTVSFLGAEDVYSPDQNQISGLTPFAYASGAMPIALDDTISADVVAGNLGAEVGLITDAAELNQSTVIGGSDNLSAQAVMFASLQEPLVGEELYVGGAYLQANLWHRASVRAQDFIRWVLIILLLTGVVLKIAGVL